MPTLTRTLKRITPPRPADRPNESLPKTAAAQRPRNDLAAPVHHDSQLRKLAWAAASVAEAEAAKLKEKSTSTPFDNSSTSQLQKASAADNSYVTTSSINPDEKHTLLHSGRKRKFSSYEEFAGESVPRKMWKTNPPSAQGGGILGQGAMLTEPCVTIRSCSADGCKNLAQNGGVCARHWANIFLCSADGCTNQVDKGGVCTTHEAKANQCSVVGCTTPTKKGGVCVRHGKMLKPSSAPCPRDDFVDPNLPVKRGQSSRWDQMFNDLLEFKKQHGHCDVPQTYPPNPKLGVWVNKQRVEHKNLDDGKISTLTDERLERLEGIGFRWAKRRGKVRWEEKYNELLQYKARFGHCHVPTKYKENTALGRWVSTQRAECKKFCKGEKSSMTAEKIRRLDSIGFAWFQVPSTYTYSYDPCRK